MIKNAIRTVVFWYAALTGHDEYPAIAGTLKFKFLNWLYDGEAEHMFDVQWPDKPQIPSPSTDKLSGSK